MRSVLFQVGLNGKDPGADKLVTSQCTRAQRIARAVHFAFLHIHPDVSMQIQRSKGMNRRVGTVESAFRPK